MSETTSNEERSSEHSGALKDGDEVTVKLTALREVLTDEISKLFSQLGAFQGPAEYEIDYIMGGIVERGRLRRLEMNPSEAIDELSLLLSNPDVPPEVVDCALRFLKSPGKCFGVEPSAGPAFGADGCAVALKASDGLLNLLAAARAGEWEDIVVKCN